MRNVSRILAALALTLAAAAASGQNATVVQANVPFAFEAAGQAMPAGDYRISLNLVNGLVLITGPDRHSISFLSSYQGRLLEGSSYLRFVRDGNDSFLREVSFSGSAQLVPLAGKKHAVRGDEMASKNQLVLVQ